MNNLELKNMNRDQRIYKEIGRWANANNAIGIAIDNPNANWPMQWVQHWGARAEYHLMEVLRLTRFDEAEKAHMRVAASSRSGLWSEYRKIALQRVRRQARKDGLAVGSDPESYRAEW